MTRRNSKTLFFIFYSSSVLLSSTLLIAMLFMRMILFDKSNLQPNLVHHDTSYNTDLVIIKLPLSWNKLINKDKRNYDILFF